MKCTKLHCPSSHFFLSERKREKIVLFGIFLDLSFSGNTVMPECYLKFHERMKGFKLRPDDIWIASFPKSGTTWTQVQYKQFF